MGFSFITAYQRAYNKGSGNKAAVLMVFPQLEGLNVIVINNIVGGGGYWFE